MKYLHEIPFACKWIINKESLKRDDKKFLKSTQFIFSTEPLLSITFLMSTLDTTFKDCKFLRFQPYFAYTTFRHIRFAYHFKFIHYFGTHDISIYSKSESTCLESGYARVIEVSTEEFFENDTSQNEKIEIECCGVVYFGDPQSFIMPQINNKNINFSIIIRKKIIKINQSDFQRISPVFAAMISSGMKESIENKLYITNFSFQVVKAVINFFRGKAISKKFIQNNFFSLIEFADYYFMDDLKEYLSFHCEITTKNFNKIMKIAEQFNSKYLQTRCFYLFLQSCFKAEPKKISNSSLKKTKCFKFEYFTNDGYTRKEKPQIINDKIKEDYENLLKIIQEEIFYPSI